MEPVVSSKDRYYNVIPIVNIVKARSIQGAISLPADSHYANFKNVKGMPGMSAGYSISKLRAFDILIERLRSIKGTVPEDLINESADMDQAINKLQQELKQIIDRNRLPFIGGESSFSGLSLNMLI